jgi:hypothetical protein
MHSGRPALQRPSLGACLAVCVSAIAISAAARMESTPRPTTSVFSVLYKTDSAWSTIYRRTDVATRGERGRSLLPPIGYGTIAIRMRQSWNGRNAPSEEGERKGWSSGAVGHSHRYPSPPLADRTRPDQRMHTHTHTCTGVSIHIRENRASKIQSPTCGASVCPHARVVNSWPCRAEFRDYVLLCDPVGIPRMRYVPARSNG